VIAIECQVKNIISLVIMSPPRTSSGDCAGEGQNSAGLLPATEVAVAGRRISGRTQQRYFWVRGSLFASSYSLVERGMWQ
jgi:hypothetical protein